MDFLSPQAAIHIDRPNVDRAGVPGILVAVPLLPSRRSVDPSPNLKLSHYRHGSIIPQPDSLPPGRPPQPATRSRAHHAGAWRNLRLIHLPVHASWFNQIEIYFSVIHRKVVTPNDFTDLAELEQRPLGFQHRYEQTAAPFDWRYTRADLDRLLCRLDEHEQPTIAARTHREFEPQSCTCTPVPGRG